MVCEPVVTNDCSYVSIEVQYIKEHEGKGGHSSWQTIIPWLQKYCKRDFYLKIISLEDKPRLQ